MTENETKHYVDVIMIEQERALCQTAIILQYDNRKIDEKKLALKLRDLRAHSDVVKDMIGQMYVLSDTI
jgi:hypothetical protein